MRLTIYKYALGRWESEIEMPPGAKFMRADVDARGDPCVWVIVDTDLPPEPQRFEIVPTGAAPPAFLYYLDTFLVDQFTYHLFGELQRTNPPPGRD